MVVTELSNYGSKRKCVAGPTQATPQGPQELLASSNCMVLFRRVQSKVFSVLNSFSIYFDVPKDS